MEKTYVEQLEEIVEAVAHIGVDFGFGAFKLDEYAIEKARKLLDQKAENDKTKN